MSDIIPIRNKSIHQLVIESSEYLENSSKKLFFTTFNPEKHRQITVKVCNGNILSGIKTHENSVSRNSTTDNKLNYGRIILNMS